MPGGHPVWSTPMLVRMRETRSSCLSGGTRVMECVTNCYQGICVIQPTGAVYETLQTADWTCVICQKRM
jgi:hypothetical protein